MRTSALSTYEKSPPEEAPGASTAIKNSRRLLYRSAVKNFPRFQYLFASQEFSETARKCQSLPMHLNSRKY
jgi:hypothetical protein